MIFVDRKSVPVPDFFSSEEYKRDVTILKQFYRSANRYQKRFVGYSIPENISKSLHELFSGKCAYCESNFDFKSTYLQNRIGSTQHYYNGIDHFRPRNYAKDFDSSKSSLNHYWWLTYEWENLNYCCDICYENKSSWFPVVGKRIELEKPYNKIIKTEKNLLIDPCNDDIDLHFDYNLETGEIIPISKKGEITIQILELNRKLLIKGRLKSIENEKKYFQYIEDTINSQNDSITLKYHLERFDYWNTIFNEKSDVEHIACRRKYVFNALNNNKELKKIFRQKIRNFNHWDKVYLNKKSTQTSIKIDELVFSDKGNTFEINILKNIQLEKIELKNYKCFDNLKINFNNTSTFNKEPWLVFLGENGVGKSSLLKAIAIGLMGQKNIDKLNFNPAKHLQYGKRVGYVRIHGENGEFIEVKFTKNKIISNTYEPSSYLIGYGSTRLLPKGNLLPETNVEYVKIKNLFDYSTALSDAKSWLLAVSDEIFHQIAKTLKDLLLLDNDDTLEKEKNRLYIKYKTGLQTDVSDLSDGYKTIFAITVDIIKTLSKDNLDFETAEGTILIDEIGTHLHPRWKMEVVSRLRKAFPKLQFIATTHEPLCLRGLGENEVVVLKKDNDDEIIAITDLPNPNDFRVDQLLTSEYFGLNSTMDFETEDLFKEYYALIAKDDKDLTTEDKKRRDELSETLPNKKHLGDDIRDELVYYVIDELLAKKVNDKGYKIIDDEIKEEALSKVKAIWKHIAKNENSL